MKIELHPIGTVHEKEGYFELHIEEYYRPALNGLSEFSHLMILWWADQFDDASYRSILLTGKTYTKGPENLGVLSTRSPVRPNPVMVTMVRLIRVDLEKGIVSIENIDAYNESKILDIKPYHPSADRIKNIKMPAWCSHWPAYIEDSINFDWSEEFNF